MASVTLSPFPGASMTAQRPAAIACIKASIAGGAKLTDDRATALGETAAALVQRFAPDAPQAVKNEAVIRLAGWMHAREPRSPQSFTVGGIRMDFRERFFAPNALHNSGARALLMPWRVRRALPAEDTSSASTAATPTDPGDGVTREELDRILEERLENVLTWR